MISSVPYVPPDTMKKVAATSGQRVSLATLFFAVGIAREADVAGSDKELNFYSRPPWATRTLVAEPTAACPQLTLTARGGTRQWSEFAFAEYKSRFRMQGKNARELNFFVRRHLTCVSPQRRSCMPLTCDPPTLARPPLRNRENEIEGRQSFAPFVFPPFFFAHPRPALLLHYAPVLAAILFLRSCPHEEFVLQHTCSFVSRPLIVRSGAGAGVEAGRHNCLRHAPQHHDSRLLPDSRCLSS